MFIPTTAEEMTALGWDRADVILVTGDTYIDSPYIGAAVIGHVLIAAGYRVGIIAQPALDPPAGGCQPNTPPDICRLGEPTLFWGITGGCMDSMVSNYTAAGKFRQEDDLTPGGANIRRPDRAVFRYCNLIRQHFKTTVPLVIGGIEASLRRIAHYDAWERKVRNSILPDAKADILVYGMAERTVLELAEKLQRHEDFRALRGLCYMAHATVPGYLVLPAADEVKKDKDAFSRMFGLFYGNLDPFTAKGLTQAHGNQYLIHNPPQAYESTAELDAIYELPYENDAHPYYKSKGKIKALDTIRFSLTTHRGCYGECHFCSIAVHQGKAVRSRSEASILREAVHITGQAGFKGNIQDVGGATANMYGIECSKKFTTGACKEKRCLYPAVCRQLPVNHQAQIDLLQKLSALPGIKRVFVASGVRHDMVLADRTNGTRYLELLIRAHISGQMKIAPEHTEQAVLQCMGKPDNNILTAFKKLFDTLTARLGSKTFLTYYFMAAHPGCRLQDMQSLHRYIRQTLKMRPEQVQVFTPTPATYATLMYYTGIDPFTGKEIFVEREPTKKQQQKAVLTQ